MKFHSYQPYNGGGTMSVKYTRQEIMDAWADEKGQGNRQAREMGQYCVLIPCGLAKAVVYSARFCRRFNIPSCCYYDSTHLILSLYCGDTGYGMARDLMFDATMMRFMMLDEDGVLFDE